MEMGGHWSVGILLYHEVYVPLGICIQINKQDLIQGNNYDLPSSLVGVYGRITGWFLSGKSAEKWLQKVHTFSISGPLYFVKIAAVTSQSYSPWKLKGRCSQATRNPETASSEGRANRNFLVLWLNTSTLSSFKSIHPWSPPRKVDVRGFGSLANGGLLELLWLLFGAAFPESNLAVL